MDNKEIFEIIVINCIVFIPIVFYVVDLIKTLQYSRYCDKVFNSIYIGDKYDLIVQDIDDPFESPYVSHYKVTNKKYTANGLFVQLENMSSKVKNSVNIKYLIENYTKI